MKDDKIKVLYIAGSGRSGSTILHNILGQIDGFFAVGELRYIWERGFVKNNLCGCGIPFRDCETWKAVMGVAFGGIDQVNAHKMFRLTESFRIHHLPSTWLPNVRQKHTSRLSEYLVNLEKLYRAIQTTTRSRVIVDSSKNPSYGYVLRMIPKIDLYTLHFIRDSRAVAHSWSKKKLFQPDDYMAQKPPIKSALQWNARNITAESFLERTPERYIMLRYEDFVDKPKTSVESILNLLGEIGAMLPFTTEHTVELEANHSIFGNAVRFSTGTVELKLDEGWKTKMKAGAKITVTALTWPLLLKYGYFHPGSRLAK